MAKKRILFVGGGTAGHINPLLTVMAEVQKLGAKKGIDVACEYVGEESDLMSSSISTSHLVFGKHAVSAGKIHRFITIKHFSELAKMLRGIGQAKRLIARLKPSAVFSKGGFVAVPLSLAAAKAGIPLFSHETDVVPGRANQFTARSATKIFTAFPVEAYQNMPKEKLEQTGQPVRAEFYAKHTGRIVVNEREINPREPIVLVIGGSQGGRRLNELVYGSWNALLPKTQIVHITGPRDLSHYLDVASMLPAELNKKLWVVPYLHEELAVVMQAATLVITRAGGTIAELAATGKPAVLVPLSTAAQNHQRANARVLEEAGAGVVVDEASGTASDVEKVVLHLLDSPNELKKMAQAIKAFDHPKAATKIAEALLASIV